MGEQIFALDIGTRSVTGMIVDQRDDQFSIVDYHTLEHKERSMRDGQIHNVIAVANVIQEVKSHLEQTHGTLASVSVAAAGRALKTVQATAERDIYQQSITNAHTIKHLELSAVHQAQLKLANAETNDEQNHYYCVGYSTLYYKLDGDIIGSLIDQRGKRASVEIIATFLPKVVVESLMAALQRAELKMEALTLEPIAAIHVLIPESMRRLNVALVDIGAGTSDIAITNKGTVTAYGMVPIAGDEITEAISDHYLLDFPQAEAIKREIVTNGQAVAEDILGFETTISYDTLIQEITPKVEYLATMITNEIIQLNTKAPKAVMLVGGGSLTPGITQALASKLQLPANRVAVRGIDAIQPVIQTNHVPTGPNFITPIGIAITAKQDPVHYISVEVNNQTVRLFEMKQLTIGDCLIQAGVDINKWYGKPGLAFMVTVNGRTITLTGEYGKPPEINCNNQLANVDTLVKHGDLITITKGQDGLDAQITLEDIVGDINPCSIYFNGQEYEITTTFYVNGIKKDKRYLLMDHDVVEWRRIRTVQDFMETLPPAQQQVLTPFHVYINNEKITVQSDERPLLYVNNEQVITNQPLKDGDKLEIKNERVTIGSILKHHHIPLQEVITVSFNNQTVTLQQPCNQIYRNQTLLSEDTVVTSGDRLEIKKQTPAPFIFQDVFRYVDIDLTNKTGKFKLHQNSQPAAFNDPLQDGDVLELTWDPM
ncbi:cell division protein FtsA [Lentibacillus sp. N15]|uniref:cell division protein FtsA n=1 Tax=Lentibacillus songyuanensis TaxID=3136161 RepID=UPI0031BB34FD